METNMMPYGVSSLDEDRYTALGQKSYKKSSRRKKKAKKPWDDYVYFYTNADMDEYSVEELATDYRKRWGIEC
jgi:IS4 transposase